MTYFEGKIFGYFNRMPNRFNIQQIWVIFVSHYRDTQRSMGKKNNYVSMRLKDYDRIFLIKRIWIFPKNCRAV